MPKIRIDHLPMDRQAAGYTRGDVAQSKGIMGPQGLTSVFEKRDIEPSAALLQRRTGSRRVTDAIPNLLGVTADINAGGVTVDSDFDTDLTAWTVFFTVRLPTASANGWFPLFQLESHCNAFVQFDYSGGNVANFFIYAANGTSGLLTFAIGDLDTAGSDFRIMVRKTASTGSNNLSAVSWPVPAAGTAATIPAETTVTSGAGFSGGTLALLGQLNDTAITDGAYDQVVITNFLLYDVADFAKDTEYEAYASDLTPDTSGSNTATSDFELLWHEKFSDGGEVLSYTNDAAAVLYSYLTPTLPSDVGDWIHFGGGGVIEIPFYLDFDEYYWTPSQAAARLEWMFQIEITLPKVLPAVASTIFDFQDILRLELGTDAMINGIYAGNGTVDSTVALSAGVTYEIFIGRNATQTKLLIRNTAGVAVDTKNGVPDNPAIFNYDKMLGFIIGDTADAENTSPFGGQVKRFALGNDTAQIWQPLKEAVFYYDATSMAGDQIIDRGNRALNGFAGTRAATAPPFYKEGGFKGGSYVAAVGGYTLAGSTPDITYTGELKKALLKDAVIQRRGSKAFLTSNGVNYLVDDDDQTFRPLGIPRPATKVSCNPQGVGVIDGFVRYAYRWVTKDGTVGPAFSLDPVDARGGVNIFLGADSYGLPGETPFGISYGELEPGETGTTDPYGDVEWFCVNDTDGLPDNNVLLKGRDIANPGLTLEVAARIPEITKLKESIFSQGVYGPVAPGSQWGAINQSQTFPWIGKGSQECTFQICFRYAYRDANDAFQTLFTIGHPDQKYKTGFNQTHWHLHDLVVSIQPPDVVANGHSIVVCRDGQGGGKKRDDNLQHYALDYNFVDGQDYCVIIRRNGSADSKATGTQLAISIFDKTKDDAAAGTGWQGWPGGSSDTVKFLDNFWPTSYATNAWKHVVMWGCTRSESKYMVGRSRARIGNTTNFEGPPNDGHVRPLAGTDSIGADGEPDGTVLYHGRMWIEDVPFQLFAQRGLERYSAQEGTLGSGLKFDIAFCSDSSRQYLNGGWDEQKGSRAYFRKEGAGAINCFTHMTQFTEESPILAYGWDMELTTGAPGKWHVTSLDDVPLWASWSSRNEGSIVIGVGNIPAVEVSTKKWHDGSKVTLFSSFADTIDFKSFTWITLYFHHIKREGTIGAAIYDVWLERVFLDGMTDNEWGNVFVAATNTDGIAANPAGTAHPYGLFNVGGMPGMDQELQVEIAEVRLWDGERYTAEGGGYGDEAFGPYMSTRLPPNIWEDLWYYIRFMKIDLDDEDTPTKLDQFGIKKDASNRAQLSDAAVFLGDGFNTAVATGAEVVDATDSDTSVNYFVPFPEPPMASIRGIQIFRTQVVPVTDNFPNGHPNPNAVSDAWRACRDAPLYYLTEIPRGTVFYTDFADDTVLGTRLDQLTGLIPRNPVGVFEWEGHLGVFVEDEPRIHFAESINSWESFPLDLIYDLPIKEKGSIKAAIELASRDARQSRVLVLGESWGVFLDGSPLTPQTNTLGGGLGASSARCLVVEKGIAYAYNGTLWAITGDGQVQDIGLPVLDLLPSPANARLSVSSALSSLLVIDESTGLVLRYYFPRGQWFVEDRYALSVTDKEGSDYWVHISGYPSVGTAGVYQDDVASDTPAVAVGVTSYYNALEQFNVASATGFKVGQRVTLVADLGVGDAAVPSIREAHTIASISGTAIKVEGNLNLDATYTDISGTVHTLLYNAYIGVGYWGTMLDTGQFGLQGDLNHVDIGVASGTKWWAASDASDFAKDPTDRSGFDSPESKPTLIGATAGRWGLSNSQRFARTIIWTPDAAASGLSEVELTYTPDPGERN